MTGYTVEFWKPRFEVIFVLRGAMRGSGHDPERLEQDMLDIKGILRANSGTLDLEIVREYFTLFKRGKERRFQGRPQACPQNEL